MFEFIVDIQEQNDYLALVSEALKELKGSEVLIGIPEEKSSRPEQKESLNNAELLYIHTNGSPVRGIPARAVIEPALEDGREIIGELLSQASEKALDGDRQGMRQALEKAGIQGQNMSRAWFTNPKNNWKELSEKSESRRNKKLSKKKLKDIEERKQNEKSFVAHRPLIDTGELRKSITYVVREK